MATLKDVATKAGVSIATVSYCINNSKSIKSTTRDKIMKAIEELNYIPNTAARSLKSENSKELGVVFPDIDDFCHTEILKGIISSAESLEYSINIAFSYNTSKLERKIIDQFIGKNMAGLMIITCQPQNAEYFQNSLVRHNIPAVFIERFPNQIDANFLAFDNYNSCYYLTKKLLEKDYRTIVIMTGYDEFFSEYECIRGFTDAHDDANLIYTSNQMIQTNISKEAAFRQTMFHLTSNPPQAIIASSQSLAKGIMEALNLYNIKVPGHTCVLTLGEECWNDSNYLPNIIHTSRTAFTLGKCCTEVLSKNIKAPSFFEKEFMLFKDNIIGSHVQIPKVPKPIPTKFFTKRNLRILATSMPTMLSLSAVSGEFERLHNVNIQFDFVSYRELIHTIVSDSNEEKNAYDIYMFDVSWLTYLANKAALRDLTPLITSNEIFQKHILPKNLSNCCYKGKYYGFPIVGGAHILFYRKDLFDNSAIQNQFQAQHNLPLRPPKTWAEFNGIAKFFTKEYNPYSPTQYGTSVIGSINEELALEIQIRLWSYGGGLYDNNGHLALDTPQNIKGFQSLLETCKYAESTFFEASIDQSFRAFGSGRTAMLLSFTEYASQINDFIHGDIVTNVDYSMLPGKTPANVGWHMGIGKQTEHTELIGEYFKWICQKRTSYYMTTLNGQSTIRYPYENHELLKLYPWLHLNQESLNNAHSRVYPYQAKGCIVPPYQIETILLEIFQKMNYKELSVQEGLRFGQKMIQELFSV